MIISGRSHFCQLCNTFEGNVTRRKLAGLSIPPVTISHAISLTDDKNTTQLEERVNGCIAYPHDQPMAEACSHEWIFLEQPHDTQRHQMHNEIRPTMACFAAALSLLRYNLSGHVRHSYSLTVGCYYLAAAMLNELHARRCQLKQ